MPGSATLTTWAVSASTQNPGMAAAGAARG
jgi:hypothetical protein